MQSEIGWVYLGEKLGILGCSPDEARKLLFCKEIARAWREDRCKREGGGGRLRRGATLQGLSCCKQVVEGKVHFVFTMTSVRKCTKIFFQMPEKQICPSDSLLFSDLAANFVPVSSNWTTHWPLKMAANNRSRTLVLHTRTHRHTLISNNISYFHFLL